MPMAVLLPVNGHFAGTQTVVVPSSYLVMDPYCSVKAIKNTAAVL